jgi:hypothetical protein
MSACLPLRGDRAQYRPQRKPGVARGPILHTTCTLILFSVACTHRIATASAEHEAVHLDEHLAAKVDTVTHTEVLPGRVTRWTFAAPSPADLAAPPTWPTPHVAPTTLPAPWGELPPHGALLTISVAETGGVKTDTTTSGTATDDKHLAGEAGKTSRIVDELDVGLSIWTKLAIAAGIAAACGAAWKLLPWARWLA